jgi:hypothetical protein
MENNKKPKNEIDDLNKLFNDFKEKHEKERLEIPDYQEIYLKNEVIKHFNRRVIECNK